MATLFKRLASGPTPQNATTTNPIPSHDKNAIIEAIKLNDSGNNCGKHPAEKPKRKNDPIPIRYILDCSLNILRPNINMPNVKLSGCEAVRLE